MCLEALGEGFSCFPGRCLEGNSRNLLPRGWIWFILKVNHCFTNRFFIRFKGNKSPQGKRYAIFPSDAQNEIFKNLKCFQTTWNSSEQLVELTQK